MNDLFSSLTTRWPGLFWILGGASFLTLIGALLLLPLILIRIPTDYFIRSRKERRTASHPIGRILRILMLFLKNILGILLLLMGVILLFTPGQGILTILAGFFIMDFPGKKKLEIRLISRNSIFHGINRIRHRAGHPPLIHPLKEPPQRKAT